MDMTQTVTKEQWAHKHKTLKFITNISKQLDSSQTTVKTQTTSIRQAICSQKSVLLYLMICHQKEEDAQLNRKNQELKQYLII